MNVCLYAGDMNLNRKDEKKYVEIQQKKKKKKMTFLGNKTLKTFFLVQMFYSPLGYKASIMF